MQQKRLGAGIAALVTAIFCLALMMSGLVIYFSRILPGNLHAQSTVIANNFLVAQMHSTQQAQMEATSNAVVNASYLQNIYAQITEGHPLYNDPLTETTSAIWPSGGGSANENCKLTGGAYHVRVPAGQFFYCEPGISAQTNFAFQAKMDIKAGSNGGLAFRLVSVANGGINGYFFAAYAGEYYLSKVQNSQAHILLEGINSAISIDWRQPTLLGVLVRGSSIALFANAHLLGSINDSAFASGGVGVFASSGVNPTDVAFNDMEIWPQ